MPARICIDDRVIDAIRKQIISCETGTSIDKTICIEETAPFGIVISALQVIQASFSVVDVAAVAQGVMQAEGVCHAAGGAKELAPGIVGIAYNRSARAVQNGHHIALQVGDIVVGRSVEIDRQRTTIGTISKPHGVAAISHSAELTAVVDIGISVSAVGIAALRPHAVSIVGKTPGLTISGHGCKLPPLCPGIAPSAVIQRIADGIIGDGLTVIVGQQIAPCGVAVLVAERGGALRGLLDRGVGELGFADDVSGRVVGVLGNGVLGGGLLSLPHQAKREINLRGVRQRRYFPHYKELIRSAPMYLDIISFQSGSLK